MLFKNAWYKHYIIAYEEGKAYERLNRLLSASTMFLGPVLLVIFLNLPVSFGRLVRYNKRE